MNHQHAFITTIKENEGLIYKVSGLYSNSREDAEDLYQEIVYQLWKAFGTFRNESKLSTWIYRIALNTSITHLNKEKKKHAHQPINEELCTQADCVDSVTEEKIAILYSHLKKLNPVDKGIILLYLEGKSYDEIASVTGFTVTNIGTRLGRIRQKIIIQIKK